MGSDRGHETTQLKARFSSWALRPFFCVIETPGSGNVVRVVNTAPVEFPMTAGIVPFTINQYANSDAVLGGDVVLGGDGGY